jgi:hypothetical protein
MTKDLIYALILTIIFEKSSIFFKNKEILIKKSRFPMAMRKARPDSQLGGSDPECGDLLMDGTPPDRPD